MKHFELKDHSGAKSALRIFLDHDDRCILLFHEYPTAVRDILRLSGTLEGIFIVISFSWEVSRSKAAQLGSYMRDLCETYEAENARLQNNVVFIANSAEELIALRHCLSNFRVVHANNTCFLSERQFDILDITKSYSAVLNAKPLQFKRAELAEGVDRLLYITYGVSSTKSDKDFYDPCRLKDASLYTDVSDSHVPSLLNQAFCGLALSAVEGACYASTEYLLCGLPVVSTISKGGRDDFYDSITAKIVPANHDDVRLAVQSWKECTLHDDVDRLVIRKRTISRINFFRAALCHELAAATGLSESFLLQHLNQKILESNKLWNFKNFWTKEIVLMA